MRMAGWAPVQANEQRVRLENRRGFQKHLIRFQRRDLIAIKGEYTAEICLLNSHDRSSAYQLHAGLFRFVCGNGLMVADSEFQRVSMRHSGFTPEEVIEASANALAQLPQINTRQRRSLWTPTPRRHPTHPDACPLHPQGGALFGAGDNLALLWI